MGKPNYPDDEGKLNYNILHDEGKPSNILLYGQVDTI